MITEQEYLEALKVVDSYKLQKKAELEELRVQAENIVKQIAINQSYDDLLKEYHQKDIWYYFPKITVRCRNILRAELHSVPIKDITQEQWVKCRQSGKKSWSDFQKAIQ